MALPAYKLLAGRTFQTQAEEALLVDAQAVGSVLVLIGNVIRKKSALQDQRQRIHWNKTQAVEPGHV